ncbi:ABC transporter substrate-binding protein [Hypericibacter adhaerens]|uniref:ABC transporter substrate-binding protein n=1 Tax=Hypericibacter adhaerens TaxID=2602016 RepID=UPI001244C141|nr:ABC transporter substrate-binding protein [Hypericibacter adhaerens]
MDRRSFLKATAYAASLASLPGIAFSARAADSKILRMGYGSDVLTLDPIKTVYGSDIIIQGMMFARLLQANADRSEVGPGLAEKWDISEDGKTYTFYLRDAKFSDGSPITAEDVAFSYTRMRFQKDSAYAAPFQPLKEAKAKDAKTVVFTLDRRFTPFLTLTEIWNTGIVPKAAVEKMGDDAYAKAPVTSGPFKFVEWKPGDRVVLARNEHYYKEGLPHLDGLEFRYVADDNTRVSMLQAGEIDVCIGYPVARQPELKAAGFRADADISSVTYDMLINHSKAPFDNLKFRQAISHGIDRQAIADAVTLGSGRPATSIFSPELNFFDKSLPLIQRDVEKAKGLLADSGVADPSFELLVSAGIADDEKTAVLVQAQLAEIGITVTVSKIDSTSVWTRLIDGDYQAELNWWYNETRDPDNALRWCAWGAGDNKSYYTRYNNEEVNKLIDEAAGETDDAKRGALYAQIQKICVDEVAQVAMFHPNWLNGYSPKVKDLILNIGLQFSEIDQTDLV